MTGVSPTSRPPLPPEKTRYALYRNLAGPQSRYGRAEFLVPTGIRARSSVTLPTELPDPQLYQVHSDNFHICTLHPPIIKNFFYQMIHKKIVFKGVLKFILA